MPDVMKPCFLFNGFERRTVGSHVFYDGSERQNLGSHVFYNATRTGAMLLWPLLDLFERLSAPQGCAPNPAQGVFILMYHIHSSNLLILCLWWLKSTCQHLLERCRWTSNGKEKQSLCEPLSVLLNPLRYCTQ